jgi:hypothetical protein
LPPTEDITLITAFLLTIAALSAAEVQVTQEIICAETAFSRAVEIRDQALSRGPYCTVRIDENGERIESWGTFISTARPGTDGKWKVCSIQGLMLA